MTRLREWSYHVRRRDGTEERGTVHAVGRTDAKAAVRHQLGGERPAMIYEWVDLSKA